MNATAQPPHNNRPDNQVSNCHQAPLITVSADEGTCYYECRKCNQPCDPMTDNQPSKNPSEEGLERPPVTPSIPDNQADWLDEVIDDCTLALTSYTLGKDKITSYDEIIIDRPKLVAAITTKIAEATVKELRELIKDVDPGSHPMSSKIAKRIAELEAALKENK